MSAGVLNWENNKIFIPITGRLENPYIDDKALMHMRKFSNIILENIDNITKGMNELSDNYFLNVEYGSHYELIKTNYDENFVINHDKCFILLPQTNQCLYYESPIDMDRAIFISHAYALIIPIIKTSRVSLLHPWQESNLRQTD